jgi:D-alanyl-D-alanine carboxypeptidase
MLRATKSKHRAVLRPEFRVLFVAALVCILSFLNPNQGFAKANPKYASIVIDAETGLVLHQRYADKTLHPASLAKMMTLLMTFEAIESGKLRLRDRIYISRHAASMIPSKLGLKPGSSIRVEDAIYALVTKSANDIAVALAEKISGTESQFSIDMTRKAREIGMEKTTFKNASGLHNSRQVTSARDMATLARYLVNEYPQYYNYFSTKRFTYMGNTYRNHNRLMDSYAGMDGLKTGYINASGFNLVASAVQNNQRIIGVVFGGRTGNSRNAHMKTLLDRGFQKLDRVLVASRSVPVPERKPTTMATELAALNAVEPAFGEESAEDNIDQENSSYPEFDPALNGQAFVEMIGQGDIDPSVSKRLETGLLAIAAMRETHTAQKQKNEAFQAANYTPQKQPVRQAKRRQDWSVQVGAFASRIKTDKALKASLKHIPNKPSNAIPVIVPLKTNEGWLFRGRISGLSKAEAVDICQKLRDCMLISPQAH